MLVSGVAMSCGLIFGFLMNTRASPILLVVAAPLESAAVVRAFADGAAGQHVNLPRWRVHRLSQRFRLLETGIGKVNAAGGAARALEKGSYAAVVNVGIAGALPASGLKLLDTVVGTASAYADEGLATPTGFMTCAEMGFPPGPFDGNAVRSSPRLLAALRPMVEARGNAAGVIATVSTCSGTDLLAHQVVDRTGALAEGMEGAAVGHVVARFSDEFPSRAASFIEVRVISNTTGDRPGQQWNIKAAATALTGTTAALREALQNWPG